MIKELMERYDLTTYEFRMYPIPFLIYTATGFWCPSNWTTTAKTYYRLYTLSQFIFSMIFFSQTVYYIYIKVDQDGKLETNPFFAAVAILFGLGRVAMFTFDQSWIIDIMKIAFDERRCKPRNEGEREVIEDFTKGVNRIHTSYVWALFLASSVKVIIPSIIYYLGASFDAVSTLPVSAWYPYEVGRPGYYEMTVLHQLVVATATIASNIGSDILVTAIMMQVCLQCRILSYRISHNKDDYDETVYIDDTVKYLCDRKLVTTITEDHLFIIEFAEKCNRVFTVWLVIMVIFPGPSLIMNVYELLTCTAKYCSITPGALIAVVGIQLLLIYWCGSEITENSMLISEAVYESGWLYVHQSVRKDYLIMMRRAYYCPISMTVVKIVSLNVNSMVALVKLAYSALNLFRTVA